jgi:hypothetical protein
MSRPSLPASLLCALFLAGCTSATDRLEQGIEAESYGQYYQAAIRYVEALEKDESLVEARDRLMEAGDSAIVTSVRTAEDRLARQDAVGAGTELIAVDRLLARARSVGVRLPTPADLNQRRRTAFDAAIDQLMNEGGDAGQRQQWGQARRAYQRVRGEFQPNAAQRRESLEAESRLLLDWALFEEDDLRFRRAFDLAEEAMAVSGGATEDVMEEAGLLQERAIAAGTHFMAVFPVTYMPALAEQGGAGAALLLSDILELDYWRQPPVFLAVADPVIVRQMTRRYSSPGTAVHPGRILEAVEADFGVLVEISAMAQTERNVRQQVRTAETSRGGTARYTHEEGTLTFDIRVEVLVVDAVGRELEEFAVTENASGSFERAVYEGDSRDLDLSRSQRRLFDPVIQAERMAAIEDRLMREVSATLADRIFRAVLNRVP